MQGTILSTGRAQGIILADDGVRYSFTPAGWRDPGVVPEVGMRVDFEARGSHAVGLYPLPGSPPSSSPTPGVPSQTLPSGAAASPNAFPVLPTLPNALPPGVSPGQPTGTAQSVPSGEQGAPPVLPPTPERRGFGSKWWHWGLVGGGVAVVAIVVMVAFLLGLFGGGGHPEGKEIARHTHEGTTYVLVEYGDELAIFLESGAPMGQPGLAEEILRSYAWRQVIEDLDIERLNDVAQRVQSMDDRVSDLRGMSNGVVSVFDQLNDLEASVPLLGSVSAMDVVRESFPAVGESEDLIRSLNSELNALGSSAALLTDASRQVSGADHTSVSGRDMEALFNDASVEVMDLESTAGSVRGSVNQVEGAAGGLAAALRASSDTPLIGDALTDFAQRTERFQSELSGLSSLLAGLESDIGTLRQDLQNAMESADETLRADLERWLPEPYDAQWPPADAEGQVVEATPQPTAEPEQAAEPATVAPPDDGGSETDGKPADYQRVYQAAYEQAYQKRYNEVFDDNRARFGGTLTDKQRRTTERNAKRIAERYAPAYAEKYAEGRSIPFAEYYAQLIAGGASPEYAAAYTEVYIVTGSKSDAYEFANRIKDGELKEYSIQLEAGKSHKYAVAYALQIDGGNSEEYAAAYAQQIEDGNSEEHAAAYAQQIEDGNSTVASQSFNLEWEISETSVESGESFTLTVRMHEVQQAGEHGGISVSFPTLTESGGSTDGYSSVSADVEALDYTNGLSNVTFHQPGTTIYHRQGNRQFPAGYLLVESDDSSWSQSDDRTLRLRITPKRGGEFPVQIRGWLCAVEYTDCVRNPSAGPVEDQQGWAATALTIEVAQPTAVAPTSPPAPQLTSTPARIYPWNLTLQTRFLSILHRSFPTVP